MQPAKTLIQLGHIAMQLDPFGILLHSLDPSFCLLQFTNDKRKVPGESEFDGIVQCEMRDKFGWIGVGRWTWC